MSALHTFTGRASHASARAYHSHKWSFTCMHACPSLAQPGFKQAAAQYWGVGDRCYKGYLGPVKGSQSWGIPSPSNKIISILTKNMQELKIQCMLCFPNSNSPFLTAVPSCPPPTLISSPPADGFHVVSAVEPGCSHVFPGRPGAVTLQLDSGCRYQ